jgi:hypothetical protein
MTIWLFKEFGKGGLDELFDFFNKNHTCSLNNKIVRNGGMFDDQFIIERKIFYQNNIFIGKVVKNFEIQKLGDSETRF